MLFRSQTYSSPLNAKRIVAPAALLKKFPGDVVQAAAGRAQIAMELAGADYAAVYMPATVGQVPFVLLCSKQGAAACALSPDLTDTAIANNILDLVRRRALGLHLSSSTITFRPGREHPLLLVSGEGQPRAAGTRFTVRRKPAALGKSAVPRPGAENPVPVGTITFESPIPASPAPAASNAPAQPQEEPPSPAPTELTTMGAAAAAAFTFPIPQSTAEISIPCILNSSILLLRKAFSVYPPFLIPSSSGANSSASATIIPIFLIFPIYFLRNLKQK